MAELKAAFRITRKRTIRRSDGTVSVEGIRYQLPAPWRHLRTVWVRYARWDLSSVDLVEGRSGERLCTLYPLDKRGNADGVRRSTSHGGKDDGGSGAAAEAQLPPLLKDILDDQDATGLAAACRQPRRGQRRRSGRDIMNRELLTLYGLKWNPFATDVPVDSLLTTPAVDSFCRRIEHHLVRQGGFALIAGEPGAGKSVALRLLAERLGRTDGLEVAVLTHPSSGLGDFYREMADLFAITLIHNNLWLGFKGLRHRWLLHFDDTCRSLSCSSCPSAGGREGRVTVFPRTSAEGDSGGVGALAPRRLPVQSVRTAGANTSGPSGVHGELPGKEHGIRDGRHRARGHDPERHAREARHVLGELFLLFQPLQVSVHCLLLPSSVWMGALSAPGGVRLRRGADVPSIGTVRRRGALRAAPPYARRRGAGMGSGRGSGLAIRGRNAAAPVCPGRRPRRYRFCRAAAQAFSPARWYRTLVPKR